MTAKNTHELPRTVKIAIEGDVYKSFREECDKWKISIDVGINQLIKNYLQELQELEEDDTRL